MCKYLAEAKINVVYKIKNINIKDKCIYKQLENLGFLKNEKIILLNHNYGKKTYLIKVMGIKYAIDKSVCDGIEIYE